MNTGSTWTLQGVAVSGPLAGHTLRLAPAYNAMWFAWSAFFPNTVLWNGEGIIDEPMTAVVDDAPGATPADFSLSQSYPNPFNGSSRISYSLPAAGRIAVEVYNEVGQQVRILSDKPAAPGNHAVSWDGTDAAGIAVASGRYFYRLSYTAANGQRRSGRRSVTLLR